MPLKLYRRNKIWHYRGSVNGELLRGSTKTSDKALATRLIEGLQVRKWESGISGPASVLTFSQAALNYLRAGKSGRFVGPLNAYWKETLVKDITAGAIRKAATDLYPFASNATRNRHVIVAAQAIINHNAELELCSHIRVKRFKAETKIRKPVTLEWVQSFMAAAPKQPHLGALALFMYLTGARVSEALRVTWKDVNLEAKTVLIGDTKTKSERLAHLPQMLIVALANIKNRRPTVFRYTSKAAADKSWRKVVERAGIEPLSFHCCRHGFATALLRAGIDPITVAKLGGWKDAQHLFKTYGHALDDRTLTERIAGTKSTQEVFELAGKSYNTGVS